MKYELMHVSILFFSTIAIEERKKMRKGDEAYTAGAIDSIIWHRTSQNNSKFIHRKKKQVYIKNFYSS